MTGAGGAEKSTSGFLDAVSQKRVHFDSETIDVCWFLANELKEVDV